MLDKAMKILRANEDVVSLPRKGRGRAGEGTVAMRPAKRIAVFDQQRWGACPYAPPFNEPRQQNMREHTDTPIYCISCPGCMRMRRRNASAVQAQCRRSTVAATISRQFNSGHMLCWSLHRQRLALIRGDTAFHPTKHSSQMPQRRQRSHLAEPFAAPKSTFLHLARVRERPDLRPS